MVKLEEREGESRRSKQIRGRGAQQQEQYLPCVRISSSVPRGDEGCGCRLRVWSKQQHRPFVVVQKILQLSRRENVRVKEFRCGSAANIVQVEERRGEAKPSQRSKSSRSRQIGAVVLAR